MSDFRSFADPDTHFTLVTEVRPVGNGGLVCEVSTGEVQCDECGQTASAPEYIPHEPDCDQDGVVSEWYVQTH